MDGLADRFLSFTPFRMTLFRGSVVNGTFGTFETGVSDGTGKCESRWLIVSVVADVSVVTDVADVAAKCESKWLIVSVVADVSVVTDVADVAAKCESRWLR